MCRKISEWLVTLSDRGPFSESYNDEGDNDVVSKEFNVGDSFILNGN